jgi:hypothetical protein
MGNRVWDSWLWLEVALKLFLIFFWGDYGDGREAKASVLWTEQLRAGRGTGKVVDLKAHDDGCSIGWVQQRP